MAAASSNDRAFNGRLADKTGLRLAAVNTMLQLKKALFPVGIHIIRNGRTTEGNRFGQDLLNCSIEPARLVSSESGSATARSDTGSEKCFVRVDISHASQKLLVE